MKRLLLLLAVAFLSSSASAQTDPNAWINEFHYENDDADTGEFIEVVVENASQYGALNDFTVVLYNGNDESSYETVQLSSFTTNGVRWGGAFSIYTYTFPDGSLPNIQNGPDGIALCYQGGLIGDQNADRQFLSYEGTFVASDGCAGGEQSVDVGVSESASSSSGSSLQLRDNQGAGNPDKYVDFSWEGPLVSTKGFPNENQTFTNRGGGNGECPAGTELFANTNGRTQGVTMVTVDTNLTMKMSIRAMTCLPSPEMKTAQIGIGTLQMRMTASLLL